MPLLIFFSRIIDVTIGTIRIICVSRGNKLLASFCGFFEVLIWLLAIGQIMKNLNNVACYVAYAGGFAMGNFIGISIEEKLAMGILGVRVITRDDSTELITRFKNEGFGVTSIDAKGITGPVNIIYTIIKRNAYPKVASMIKEFNPEAFYAIEDVRNISKTVFPAAKNSLVHIHHFSYFTKYRKRK